MQPAPRITALKSRIRGATLVELSIVMLVTATLIAGATMAKTLINNGDLLKVIRELKGIEVAITQFQSTYNYLPGDYPKASEGWAGAHDGNGDNIIAIANENYYVWEHLFKAGLISTQYTGGNTELYTSIHRGVYMVANVTVFGVTGHAILLGSPSNGGTAAYNKVFTTEETSFIDKKIDDGVASQGRLLGVDGADVITAGDCSASPTSSGKDGAGNPILYNRSFKKAACRLVYWLKK
jgi:hypothetical protein